MSDVKKYLGLNSVTRLVNKILERLDTKVDKESGKGLSTNDYTTTEKNKLAGIAAGANNYTLPLATSSELGGIKSGGDITVDASGNVTVNDDSHNHVISNVDGLQTALDNKASSSHTHDNLYDTKGAAADALTSANTHTDTAVSQKSLVQIVTWEAND